MIVVFVCVFCPHGSSLTRTPLDGAAKRGRRTVVLAKLRFDGAFWKALARLGFGFKVQGL